MRSWQPHASHGLASRPPPPASGAWLDGYVLWNEVAWAESPVEAKAPPRGPLVLEHHVRSTAIIELEWCFKVLALLGGQLSNRTIPLHMDDGIAAALRPLHATDKG